MGAFHVRCVIQSTTSPRRRVELKRVLVDSGSELSWIPGRALVKAAVTVRKKDVQFVLANGQTVTRDVGYAILRVDGFETVDEVVFGQERDLPLLGARTLEGFGATVDSRRKRLVTAGPYPAAVTARTPHPTIETFAIRASDVFGDLRPRR